MLQILDVALRNDARRLLHNSGLFHLSHITIRCSRRLSLLLCLFLLRDRCRYFGILRQKVLELDVVVRHEVLFFSATEPREADALEELEEFAVRVTNTPKLVSCHLDALEVVPAVRLFHHVEDERELLPGVILILIIVESTQELLRQVTQMSFLLLAEVRVMVDDRRGFQVTDLALFVDTLLLLHGRRSVDLLG